ncbi:MAG: nucleotidyltransferase [Bdellovibrionaceae bacterium]|nr:nucleotidyltransferase [Pseudobdellovibrionaceae bacterium]
MKFPKHMSIGEFAARVASQLEEQGISTVLTGGAVVSIYTENKYMSYDADFITESDNQKINGVMKDLGFQKQGKDFKHPDTDFFVEFPTGPLAVGDLQIKATGELDFKGHKLKLLSPTESVMDRLAGYFHWNDLQNLDQAVWIAENILLKWKKSESGLNWRKPWINITTSRLS